MSIGINSIQAAILELVGCHLVGEPDTSTFLEKRIRDERIYALRQAVEIKTMQTAVDHLSYINAHYEVIALCNITT